MYDENWDSVDASVVCKQLGYATTGSEWKYLSPSLHLLGCSAAECMAMHSLVLVLATWMLYFKCYSQLLESTSRSILLS